jgi:hypothetical protein
MLERLHCIYGWPRSGTTSIAGEVNKSDLYRVWIEKNLFSGKPFESLEALLAAAEGPGAPSQLARDFNRDRVAPKKRYRVLGEKTTWMGGLGRADALKTVHANLVSTAKGLGLEHEIVVCIRKPAAWLASWSMTHLVRERGPDQEFWNGPMDDRDLESFFGRALADYQSHLEHIETLAGDPRVWIRCLERTDLRQFDYTFDFAEYVRHAAQRGLQSGHWLGLLQRRKRDIEGRFEGIEEVGSIYERLAENHRPYAIEYPDGSVREV